jgi:hypothetical protein
MPLQLVFTSAPQGLAAGRSGYCTVARHRAMPDRLATLLESIGTPHESGHGATFTFRTLEAAGRTWYVLSRFVARGLDYTQRDNRLAHHLVFSQEEAAVLPPPAAVAARWKGWHDEWSDTPAWLEGEDKPLPLETQPPLSPASAWRELTGTGAKAAWLVNAGGAAPVALIHPPETTRLLRLLAESSALLGKAAWAATFTTDAATTGADGFLWAAGKSPGRQEIDFATAVAQPAPTGEFARAAAMGTSAAKPSAPGQRRHAAVVEKSARSGPPVMLYAALGTLTVIGVIVAFLFLSKPASTPPPTPEPAPRIAPPPVDTAKIDEINRANQALRDVDGFLSREDYVAAARLWMETSALSPSFSKNYSEQVLPRLKTKFAGATADQLAARLEKPGATADPRAAKAIAEEASEALRVGAQLGIAKDAQWQRLGDLAARAGLVVSLDIRPTLLIQGEWVTADLGPNGPSQADFKLTPEAAERIGKFIENSGANSNSSVPARVRVLPLSSLHERSDTRFLNAEIRRGSQSNWIESVAEPGRQPAVAIAVGSRSNIVTLHFPDRSGSQPDANRLIEVVLGTGERQCFALIAEIRNLRPLNLGLGALRMDPDTKVVSAAPWAEPAVNSLVWTRGSIGLYPDGHEFPDRDLPSIRATRSLLETDLIRLENKSGPGTPSTATLAERRKFLADGDHVRAGAPWTLFGVDPRGARGPALVEFR